MKYRSIEMNDHQEYIEPPVFKPFTYLEIIKPLSEIKNKNQVKICVLVKIPNGYRFRMKKILRDQEGNVERIIYLFSEIRKFQPGSIGKEEFYFEELINFTEIKNFNKGIPVQVVAPHDPAGRPIFHDGTSSPHAGDGD